MKTLLTIISGNDIMKAQTKGRNKMNSYLYDDVGEWIPTEAEIMAMAEYYGEK